MLCCYNDFNNEVYEMVKDLFFFAVNKANIIFLVLYMKIYCCILYWFG